ncbi:MAG TPA: hypothetical protein VGO21_02945 [Candidatus Paceibacterota bacterium]|jgi:hypothetical protein|nr:hypothetical protein [Candidatus Paceibacterota bacterium]
MNHIEKNPKGYNKKNPAQPQGSIKPDKNDEKPESPATTSPNEKLSMPDRKLKKDKKQ